MIKKKVLIALLSVSILIVLSVTIFIQKNNDFCEIEVTKLGNGGIDFNYFIETDEDVINAIDTLIEKYTILFDGYDLFEIPAGNSTLISRVSSDVVKYIRVFDNIISVVEYKDGLIYNEFTANGTEEDLLKLQEIIDSTSMKKSYDKSRIPEFQNNAATIGFFTYGEDKILDSNVIVKDESNLLILNNLISDMKTKEYFKFSQNTSENIEIVNTELKINFERPYASNIQGGLMIAHNNGALAFISHRYEGEMNRVVVYPNYIEITTGNTDSEEVTEYYTLDTNLKSEIISILDSLK